MRFWTSTHRLKPEQAEARFDRYEAYSKLLDRNGRWIEVADTKAAVVLGFLVATFPVLIGPALSAIQTLGRDLPKHAAIGAYLKIVGVTSLLVAFISLACFTLLQVLMVLAPRLKRQWKSGLVYFGDIAALPCDAWQEQLHGLDSDALAHEVLEQVHATACIAHCKHGHVRQAVQGILATLGAGLALYLIATLLR
jgi:hypothetical protein